MSALHYLQYISRLLYLEIFCMIRNNPLHTLRLKGWGVAVLVARFKAVFPLFFPFYSGWLEMDHLFCLVLYYHYFLQKIILSFCLTFPLTQTGWKQHVSGIFHPKSPWKKLPLGLRPIYKRLWSKPFQQNLLDIFQ